MNKILLVDGLSILNRAFYGIRPMENSSGTPTNAIHGFLNMVLRFIEDEKPTHMAVAFDISKQTFRHDMYKDYKAGRKSSSDELKIQIKLMKELLTKMNVAVLTKEGFEADDIIGTLSKICDRKGVKTLIYSGDKDLFQLATENVKICIPRTKSGKTETQYYLENDIKTEYGVTPTEFIDVKALMGDTSDNIPGVFGIGEKTALKLIAQYGSIENIYEKIEEIKPESVKNKLKNGKESAIMSKVLATIDTNVDLDLDMDDCLIHELKNKNSVKMLEELELKAVLERLKKID